MGNYCDPATGICTPSSLEELNKIGTDVISDRQEIIYVGDPMCSWCWGISPALIKLRDHFVPEKVAFRVLVGGLRPGGGEPWDDEMKGFLRHHWDQVSTASGQPFTYDLLDRDEFNYDTEPSCRAVVAARPLVREKEMEFFEAVQYKFYAESQDPTQASFYKSICQQLGVDYEDFLSRFESEKVSKETTDEFQLNRQWGVRGYPTIILLNKDKLHMIANGYATFEQMKERTDHWLASEE